MQANDEYATHREAGGLYLPFFFWLRFDARPRGSRPVNRWGCIAIVLGPGQIRAQGSSSTTLEGCPSGKNGSLRARNRRRNAEGIAHLLSSQNASRRMWPRPPGGCPWTLRTLSVLDSAEASNNLSVTSVKTNLCCYACVVCSLVCVQLVATNLLLAR